MKKKLKETISPDDIETIVAYIIASYIHNTTKECVDNVVKETYHKNNAEWIRMKKELGVRTICA
jgi:hypothetical protein